MSVALFKYLDGDWPEAKGWLYQDLEHLEIVLNQLFAEAFDDDNHLSSLAVPGDSTIDTVYISNEGENHTPKWARINLENGVKNRLALSHLAQIDSSTLLGRGSTPATTGNVGVITLGAGLTMSGSVLSAASGPDTCFLTRPFMGAL